MEQEDKPSFMDTISKRWQYLLDKSSPHVTYRWAFFGFTFFVYLLRAYFANGWYIVTYGLGIYLLNQLIGFLSPQVNESTHITFILFLVPLLNSCVILIIILW